MVRAQDRSYTRRDTWMLLVTVGLSLVGIFAPPGWGNSVSALLRGSVLAPLVWLQDWAEEGRTSRARLHSVTAQRDSAALVALALPELRAENERLRRLLALGRRLHTPTVAAEVLHQAQVTDGRTILLGVGSNDGVHQFDPIVSPEGLLGVVVSVTGNSAVGMTWANPDFRVSAATLDGSAFGIVAPPAAGGDAMLELHGVPYRDSVPSGTIVLSSGVGGVYPRGLPIGTITGVESEQPGWERVYRVKPAASPAATAHVLVLLDPERSSVDSAFPTDSILRAMAADSAARQARADSLLRVRIADSVRAADRAAAVGSP